MCRSFLWALISAAIERNVCLSAESHAYFVSQLLILKGIFFSYLRYLYINTIFAKMDAFIQSD